MSGGLFGYTTPGASCIVIQSPVVRIVLETAA